MTTKVLTKATVETTGTIRGERIFREIQVEWDASRPVEENFTPAREGVPAQHRIFIRHEANRFEREVGVQLVPILITRFVSVDTAEAEVDRLLALRSHGVKVLVVNNRRVVTIEDSVEQCKKEVLEILRDGVHTSRGFERPTAEEITEFGDLHSLCDANTLGWLCDDDNDSTILFVDDKGAIHDHRSEEGNERWMEFGNVVQEQVHQWILARGHHCYACDWKLRSHQHTCGR